MPATLDRTSATSPNVERAAAVLRQRAASRGTAIYFALLLATVVFTPLLILAGNNQGYGQVLAVIVAAVALALVPWKPIFGLYLVVISAVVIEQEPLVGTPIGTDHLNIFYWPAKLQGM